MTATQPTPMAPTSDPRPDPAPAPAPAAAPEVAASEAMPRTWFRDYPIQAVLVTALTGLLTALVVGLSIFSLTTLDNKIEKVDTKVDGLDDKVDEINLKLTALIAGLGMTDLVDAAVEGRLPAAEPAGSEPAGAPN